MVGVVVVVVVVMVSSLRLVRPVLGLALGKGTEIVIVRGLGYPRQSPSMSLPTTVAPRDAAASSKDPVPQKGSFGVEKGERQNKLAAVYGLIKCSKL